MEFIRIPLSRCKFRGLEKTIWIIEQFLNIFQVSEFKLKIHLPREIPSNAFNDTHVPYFEFEC